MTEALAASPAVHALGLALVHFVWQGAVIALLSAGILALLARATASTRYVVASSGLAAMIMTPVLTLVVLTNIGLSARPVVLVSPTGVALATTADAQSIAHSATVAHSGSWPAELDAALRAITFAWSIVVLALTLRLAHGWVRVERIRRSSTEVAGESLRNATRRMAIALRIRSLFRVTESAAVDVPMVIGWLRPVILMPASAVAQLSPGQLEAIIAHELAHIRRHDYLVNALQNLAETLFFYHPGVWWISQQIRIEREHCCDDLAVEACGDRIAYARALATLEESRQPSLVLGMSATAGSLLSRIRRLLGAPDTRRHRAPVALVLCLTAVTMAPFVGRRAEAARVSPPVDATAATQQAGAQSPQSENAVPRPAIADGAGTFLSDQLLAIEAKLASYPAGHPRNDPSLIQVLREYASLRSRYDQLLVAKARQGGAAKPPASSSDGAIRLVEERLIQATLTNDIPALTALLDDDYVAVIQAGTTLTKAEAIEMYRRLRFQTLTVTPESIRITGDVATVTGTQVEVRTQGSDSMLFAHVWTRRPNGDWRLRSNTQFRDPRARPNAPLEADSRRPVAPPPLPAGAALRVGGDVHAPRKVKNVSPVYPADARASGIQGLVILETVIDTEGNVVDPKILRSVPQLDQAALDAVSQWKYEPTLLNGLPISVIMTVTVNFSLAATDGAQGAAPAGPAR